MNSNLFVEKLKRNSFKNHGLTIAKIGNCGIIHPTISFKKLLHLIQLAAPMLLSSNISTYYDSGFEVQESTTTNISKIYHNYTVGNRCYLSSVLFNDTLLFLKTGNSELLLDGINVPCTNVDINVDRKLLPDVNLPTVTLKSQLYQKPHLFLSHKDANPNPSNKSNNMQLFNYPFHTKTYLIIYDPPI